MVSFKMNSMKGFQNLTGYVTNSACLFKQNKQCLYLLNLYIDNSNIQYGINHSYSVSCYDRQLNNKRKESECIRQSTFIPSHFARQFCINVAPKNADIFGDLSFNDHERVEMDEDEAEEEKFVENEVHIPKWQKLSPGQYSNLIKSHIGKGDLKSALGVLDLIKENRDKPTVYMYNLLIRAFAIQGDIKQCFKLYNNMKKRALIPTAPTYNSLINACAETKDTTIALEKLQKLREHFHEQKYPLNDTHYNSLIKAYSWHNNVAMAFQLADEMWDKRISVTEITYGCLFHAAITDKESGLRHALLLWYMMQKRRVKRSIIHYNLLLRAVRDTKLGMLKPDDMLVSLLLDTKILISQSEHPDLLASPPKLNSLLLGTINKSSELKADDSMVDISVFGKDMPDAVETLSTYLNKIFSENRLILFGGFENILKNMERDNVKPNVKTMSIILETLPNTSSLEESLINYASKKDIPLDVDFFNILIKKRNMSGRFKDAKSVLNEIQIRNLQPNIMTFGVLALGCRNSQQGMELLHQMSTIGFAANSIIVGSLLCGALKIKNFKYVLDLLHYMLEINLKPSKQIYEFLDSFQETVQKIIKNKKNYNRKEMKVLISDFKEFKEEYVKWQEKIENKLNKERRRRKITRNID